VTATIRINGTKAVYSDHHWSSENASLANLLNSMLDPYGVSPSDPNPAASAAEQAVATLGGEILSVDEAVRIPGVIY
jgi:hypothetical protein